MSLPSAIKLFIDPRTGDAFGNFAGTTSLTNPVFTLGDTATVELYLVESTGLNTYPRQEIGFPTSPGIRVAVGAIDESPLAGTWTLSYGGDTTTALAFNATPAVVQAALNLLASITAAGGVTVAKIGDNYNIIFNANGARTELTTNGAALIPLSAATVASLQTGDANKPAIYLVHLQRTVAGLATSFSPTAASAITVEALTAWDGTKATYRASISPDPKGGSFSLSFDAQTGTDVSTAAISVGASALDVQNALSLGALADGKVSVTQVGAYAYDITVKTQPATAGLTADAAGLLSFSGYKGELNLNTAEAISLLDGAPFVQTTLEVEITSNSKTLTVLQIQCTLQNAVIDAGAVQPLVLDTYLSQTTADGRYFRLSQNLADGTAGTMRTNLGVYSTSQVDTALALKADLSGATFSGTIYAPTVRNLLNADLVIDSYNDTGAGTHYLHKFTPFDGKLVLATNGGGLTFPDSTTQTTAFTGTLAISSVTGLQTALDGKAATSHTQAISTITGLQTALDGKAATSHTQEISSITGLQTNLASKANLTQPLFIDSLRVVQNSGSNETSLPRLEAAYNQLALFSPAGSLFYVGMNTGGSVPDVYIDLYDNVMGIGTKISGGKFQTFSGGSISEPYLRTDCTNTLTGKLVFPNRLPGYAAPINLGAVADNIGNPSVMAEGDIFLTDIEPLAGNFNTRLNYVGKTFSGSLAAIQVAVLNGVSNFFSQTQTIQVTNNTQSALTVRQLGTGDAFRVEDESPETTPFVINNAGRVGIGVAPDATAALRVDANGIRFNTAGTQTVPFIDAPSDGNYYVRRNGAWYLCGLHTNGGVTYLTI